MTPILELQFCLYLGSTHVSDEDGQELLGLRRNAFHVLYGELWLDSVFLLVYQHSILGGDLYGLMLVLCNQCPPLNRLLEY